MAVFPEDIGKEYGTDGQEGDQRPAKDLEARIIDRLRLLLFVRYDIANRESSTDNELDLERTEKEVANEGSVK